MDAFAGSKERGVIAGIESVANEFELPLVAEVATERTRTLVEELFGRFVAPDRVIEVENLLHHLNQMRPGQPDLSLPGFGGHPRPHESAIGGCHGKAEAAAAIVHA